MAHHFMIIQLHTKYHKSMTKDKRVTARMRKFSYIQLFDLEILGQGYMKVMMIHDTPSYDNTPAYQISYVHVKI